MKEDLVLIGFFLYTDRSFLKYECKVGSFGFALNPLNISEWKSTGIYNHSSDSSMIAVANTKTNLPNFKNDGRINVNLNGNHFKQNLKFFLILTMLLIFIAFIN